MSNKKRAKKKYNPVKQGVKACRFVLKDCAVVWSLGTEKCVLMDTRDNSVLRVSSKLGAALTEIRHDWNVHLVVLLVHGDDVTYKQRKCYERDCFQYEIAESLNEKHMEFMREQNKNHVGGLAWIATPYNSDFETRKLAEMIDAAELYCDALDMRRLMAV